VAAPYRIGLISNPCSGHNRERFAALRACLDACPGVLHRITPDHHAIAPALAEFRATGIETLVINGGDGTVAAVLGELLEGQPTASLPSIMVLPAGTANMTAGDVGVRGSLHAAVRRFCAWAASGAAGDLEMQHRPLLRLHTGETIRYGFFLGGGAVIAGTEFAHESLHARGLRDDFSLALGVARSIWGIARQDARFLHRTPVSITVDNSATIAVDGLIIAASTLHRLAFGMRPFWGSGPGTGRLTVLEHGCRWFVPNFLRIIAGHPGRGCRPERGYRSVNFQQLRLRTGGTLNFDGELLAVDADHDVVVEPTPALRFLRL
jgi:hypothetical protein